MALKNHVPGSLKCNVPFFLWDCVNYGVVAQLGKYLDTNYTGNKKLNVFIKCDDVEFKGYLLIIGKVSSSHLKWIWSGRLKVSGTFCSKGPHIWIHSKIARVLKWVDFMEICFPSKVAILKTNKQKKKPYGFYISYIKECYQ